MGQPGPGARGPAPVGPPGRAAEAVDDLMTSEVGIQDVPGGRPEPGARLLGQLVEQEARRLVADVVLRDADGSEHRAPPLHERHVVVADDGDAGRARAPGLLRGGVAAQGHQVVPGQDRRDRRVLAEQVPGRVPGAAAVRAGPWRTISPSRPSPSRSAQARNASARVCTTDRLGGPVTWAITWWPRPARCATAAWTPARSSLPTAVQRRDRSLSRLTRMTGSAAEREPG